MATTRYVSQINGNPIFATRAEYTKSGVDIDEALSGIANGVFEVANLTTGANPHPDVQNPSHKIIYLTKESGSSKTDPYTEWIYTQSNAWEVIGETSIDLSGYKTKQTAYPASGLGAGKTITALTQNANGEISATAGDISITSSQIVDMTDTYSSSGTSAVTGKAIAAALGDLDSDVTSSDGTNVQVEVTEVDGKISAVNITTDNTENKNNKVTSWQSTPDDTHYPSEKLVKDTIDANGKGFVEVTTSNTSYEIVAILNDGKIPYIKETVSVSGYPYNLYLIYSYHSSNPGGSFYYFTQRAGDTVYSKYNKAAGRTPEYWSELSSSTLTDTKVKATAKTDNANYKILATASASPTSGDATEAVYDADITLNPSTNTISANISGDAATASSAKSGSALETAISGKADMVSNATSGNFAGLDSNGNLTDSGKKASDFATAAQGSMADSAIQGVEVNGTRLTPDSTNVVDILPATSAAYGVVQLGYVDL